MSMMLGICKRYKVTFINEGIAHKTGEEAFVSFPVAVDFYQRGLIDVTKEMLADAQLYGCELKKKRIKKGKK